jgi:predicted KAP-like P-loop ATPase
VKHIHPVASKIVDAVDEYNKKVSAVSVDDLKKKINDLIAEKQVKLYIFLDDLDRLEPEEVVNIFKTIKLNANFLNTYFFVSYDKKVVIHSLTKQFGENSADYLEKIVQVDFVCQKSLKKRWRISFLEG